MKNYGENSCKIKIYKINMIDFHLLNHIRRNDDYVVIWLFNIGVEKYWNGEVFTVKNTKEDIVVNHLEELNEKTRHFVAS